MAGRHQEGARREARVRRSAVAWAISAATATGIAGPAGAEPLIWSLQAEQFEYRFGEDEDVLAWEVDAFVGTDALKLRYQGEGEFGFDADALEAWENRLVLQAPVSPFFDGKIGVRYDAPDGPDRVYGVIGVQGLAPQWFEVDLDAFLSEKGDTSVRLEAEYEGLITNRIILTPSIEAELPFSQDAEIGVGAFGPTIEVGARLSYDLIDRAVAPYVGVHYERSFGDTADFAREDGGDDDAIFAVVGLRLMF
jgi:copper resistance protein B